MNGDAKKVFLDTNVLIYAAMAESPLHEIALKTIAESNNRGTELWISDQILREYYCVLTRPNVFENPLPISTIILHKSSSCG